MTENEQHRLDWLSQMRDMIDEINYLYQGDVMCPETVLIRLTALQFKLILDSEINRIRGTV